PTAPIAPDAPIRREPHSAEQCRRCPGPRRGPATFLRWGPPARSSSSVHALMVRGSEHEVDPLGPSGLVQRDTPTDGAKHEEHVVAGRSAQAIPWAGSVAVEEGCHQGPDVLAP